MLLAFDVGNTNIVLGVFDGATLIQSWRLQTLRERTSDELGLLVDGLFAHSRIERVQIRGIILGSVVPPLTPTIKVMAKRYFGVPTLTIEPGVETGMPILYENPREVGADRIVNTLAAVQLFKKDTIVVDFGTATTFDCITADGRFIGGVIMPGLRTASDELVRKTAKLPATELTPPTHAIGRRTEDCIRAGVLWGTADAVDGLVRRIKAEWPSKTGPMVVGTGGLAGLVAPLCREIESVHPDLTLVGLRIAATALGLKW